MKAAHDAFNCAYDTALQLQVDALEGVLNAVIFTIGGTAEGLPTHRGNVLQRLRRLVAAEDTLKRIAKRKPSENQAAAAFFRSRQDARAVLASDTEPRP